MRELRRNQDPHLISLPAVCRLLTSLPTLSRSALALSLSSFAEVSEGNKPVKENSSASEEIILGLFKYSRQLGAFLKYPSLHLFVRC